MNCFTNGIQWTVLALTSMVLCPLHAQAQDAMLNTYDIVVDVTDEDVAFGPISMTVVPGYPARLSVTGNAGTPDLEVRILTNPYRLKAGSDAVLLDMMVLRRNQERWSIMGEPRLVLRTGQSGSVTVDRDPGRVEFHVEINAGQPIKVDVAHQAMTNCARGDSIKTQIAAQDLLTFSSGLEQPQPLSISDCCSAPCQDGGGTLRCCGAVSCCACGACCETGSDFYTQ